LAGEVEFDLGVGALGAVDCVEFAVPKLKLGIGGGEELEVFGF
jgi:hypothetical protein